MKKVQRTILIACLCLVMAACGQSQEGPVETSHEQATSTFLPSRTDTQTAIPPTSTPTATPVPSGRCDNPLMSLDVNNWWHYTASSSFGQSEYSLQVKSWEEIAGLNANVEMVNRKTGVVDYDLVTCLEGGGIEDFPLFFVSMQLGDYLDGVLNTFYQHGTYAPSYQILADANWLLGWQAEYLTEEGACFVRILNDVSLCVSSTAPVDLMFSTEGQYEQVTVPAGTFPHALKVSFILRLPTTVDMPGLSAGGMLTIRTTQWYELFLGLVRSEVVSSGVELLPGQISSAQIDSVIELVDYGVQP